MAQIRGTAGYHLGNQQFGGPGSADVCCIRLLFVFHYYAYKLWLCSVIDIGAFADIELTD
jgi:hypothetical protein